MRHLAIVLLLPLALLGPAGPDPVSGAVPGSARVSPLGSVPGSIPGSVPGSMSERAAVPAPASDPGRIVARLAEPETRGAARAELLDWIRGLAPDRAALWLHLAASLDRLAPELGLEAARAVLRADEAGAGADAAGPRREAGGALGLLAMEGPPEEEAILLALAARILDPVDARGALFLRERYLALAEADPEGAGPEGWRGPEAAEVVLFAAQALLAGVVSSWSPPAAPPTAPPGAPAPLPGVAADLGAPADAASPRAEALRILETFLAQDPGHPLAPEARRLRTEALAGGREVPATRGHLR